MKYFAIIVAGGSGNRMKNSVPKQFMQLDGKPILMHSIEKFYYCGLNPEIIVVLSDELRPEWQALCTTHQFTLKHSIVNGGLQRFHSVKNGLAMINEEGIVAVHDAARPLLSTALIFKSFKSAEEKGNSVTGVTPTDSIRQITSNHDSISLNRNDLFLVQTPQTFRVDQLKSAYEVDYSEAFTDDASVVESAGFPVNLIEGERNNIKITYPGDVDFATLIIKKTPL